MDTTQTEATTEFVSDDEGQADIIDQVVNEADGETMQAEEAVELGTRAARLTNRQEPGALDALAAAYAAAGRFDEAVATAREAVALLPADQAEVRAAMAYRLQLYSQGLPFQRPR